MQYRILLPTPSPLYAPIYHAWATAGDDLREKYPIQYALEHTSEKDELLTSTVGFYAKRDVLFAVGDLTRLHRCFTDKTNFMEPVIIRGLIDRMCLWLVDGNGFKDGAHAPDTDGDHLIICHPQHMTTYHVASYYAQEILKWKEDALSKRLVSVLPGDEHYYYHKWKDKLKDKRKLSYMSTAIPSGYDKVVENFHQVFDDVSMTGIFTSGEVYRDHPGLIDGWAERIKNSVAKFQLEDDEFAWDMHKKRDHLRSVRFNTDYADIQRQCEVLKRINGYSTNLALNEKQLLAMANIRAKVEDIIPTDLVADLKRCFVEDMPDKELDPLPAADFLTRLKDGCAEVRSAIAENDLKRPVALSRSEIGEIVWRTSYTTLTFALGIKEFISAWNRPKALEVACGVPEISLATVLFILILVTDGRRIAFSFKDTSLPTMVCFTTSLWILWSTAGYHFDPNNFAQHFATASVTCASVLATWIGLTRKKLRLRYGLVWAKARLCKWYRARRDYKLLGAE